MKSAADMLGLINETFTQISEKFTGMTKRQMSVDQLDRYMHQIYPDPHDKHDKKAAAKAEANRRWSIYFFEQGSPPAAIAAVLELLKVVAPNWDD